MMAEALVRVIEAAIAAGHLGRRDVLRLVSNTVYEPEAVRLDLVRWLTDIGVFGVLGRDGRDISPCPFSEKELREADERNEVPIVIPGGLERRHLTEIFKLRHWVFGEAEVTSRPVCSDDRWLLVSASDTLLGLGESCAAACAAAEQAGFEGLSLEEYVLVAYRVRYLTSSLPDTQNWTWLPKSSYASLVLCAMFPSQGDIFVNVWPVSEFHSNVGLRVARGVAPEHGRGPVRLVGGPRASGAHS